MSKRLRQVQKVGPLYLKDIDWHFRVYLLMSDPTEIIDRNTLFTNLTTNIRSIVANCLSEEFTYLRTGFILAHYGRRGVAHSIWHWADWSGNWEYFCQSFYCYDRKLQEMAPLDRTEPILCLHEIEVVTNEALAFKNIVLLSSNHEEIIQRYRDASIKDSKTIQ